MAYSLTRSDIASITDVELAFSTERFLPAWKDIPSEFKKGNIYTKVAEAYFMGFVPPKASMVMLPDFQDDRAINDMLKCIKAHLQSFGPKHEHKIAGVGLMISRICIISEAT